MLEQLMGLIKDNSQEAIVNNPAIPNEHNNDAMQTILSSIVGGLANQQSAGNSSGLFGLLSGKSSNLSSNPIVSGIANQAIGSLMTKFGLDKSAAGGIISAVLPSVLGSFINKTNDPNDSSIDLSSVMGAVMGNSGQQNAGGGMIDLLGSVLGGAQQQQQPQQQQGGGLMDLLGGFLKQQQQ
jgi:Bacterial protein of unknown function (DUF937)